MLSSTSKTRVSVKKRPILISAALNLAFYLSGTLLVLYTIFAVGLQNTRLGTIVATISLEGGLVALAFNKRWGWLLIAFFQSVIAYAVPNTVASLIMLVPALFFAWTFFGTI